MIDPENDLPILRAKILVRQRKYGNRKSDSHIPSASAVADNFSQIRKNRRLSQLNHSASFRLILGLEKTVATTRNYL
jgi:hypothetical protein